MRHASHCHKTEYTVKCHADQSPGERLAADRLLKALKHGGSPPSFGHQTLSHTGTQTWSNT